MSDEEVADATDNAPPEETETEKVEESEDSSDLISRANAAAERLEAGNKELAKNIALLQKAKVESTLSGKTTAGTKSESKEEKEIAEAKKMLEGTGMEDYAFPEEKTKS